MLTTYDGVLLIDTGDVLIADADISESELLGLIEKYHVIRGHRPKVIVLDLEVFTKKVIDVPRAPDGVVTCSGCGVDLFYGDQQRAFCFACGKP